MILYKSDYEKINFTIKRLIFFMLIIITTPSFGQNFKGEKRIYLLDITGSMFGEGKSENIFDQVKASLIDAINAIDNPTTDVTVITFGKSVKDKWSAKASTNGKNDLISKINNIGTSYTGKDIQQATNIAAALEGAYKEININRINYLFLYTDGGHNFYNDQYNSDLQCVRNIVDIICEKNNGIDDVYPFYIMLTEKANSQELRDALSCITIVNNATPEIVIVRPEKRRSSINLLENNLTADIRFVSNKNSSLSKDVIITAQIEANSFFTIDKTKYQLSSKLGTIKIQLIPMYDLNNIQSDLAFQSELELSFDIDYNGKVDPYKSVEMRPNSIIIDVINIREKTVSISIIEEEE
jgi:hypothetical protein